MLGRFGKLGSEMEFFRLLREDSVLIATHIKIIDAKGQGVANVRIELRYGNKVIFVATTDSNGIATLKSPEGYDYTLSLSGTLIEPMTVPNFQIGDSVTITAQEKKYLTVQPDFIWLTPSNFFKSNVDILSNTEWIIK